MNYCVPKVYNSNIIHPLDGKSLSQGTFIAEPKFMRFLKGKYETKKNK